MIVAPATVAPARRWLSSAATAGVIVGWFGAVALVGLKIPALLSERSRSFVDVILIGVIALIVLVVFVFARPQFVFVAAFLLLSVVRIEPAPVDVLFALLIIATATRVRPFARVPPLIGLGLAFFAILTIASMVNASGGQRMAKFEFQTLYLVVLGLWLSGMFASATLVRLGLKAYVITALVSAVLAILAFKVQFPGRSVLLWDPERPRVLFKDPNVFGPFLVPAAAIVFEETIRPRLLGWGRMRSLIALMILSSGVVFSFSRAAGLNLFLTLLAVTLIYAVRARGLATTARLIGVLSVCAMAGLALLAATHSLSFLESRAHLKSYDQQRFATQTEAWQRASEHVLGFGPGETEVRLDYSAHSLYARVAYEQGWIGEALLIGILGATLLAAAGLAARDRDLFGLGSATLLASWLGLLANSIFVDTLHWRHFWIFAALIWCASTMMHDREISDAFSARVGPIAPPPTFAGRA
jgi:hypothetical protein